jgi:hypothetical protein
MSSQINEQSNSDLLLGFIFVSLPFEFFQKRGPHKVGDANKFMPRCALNFEEHGVRYAGLDGSLSAAVNTLPRLRFRRGLVCGSRGTTALLCPLHQINTFTYNSLVLK